MNVIHICASDALGGAARAAFRLHRSFSGLECIDSSMLVKERASDDKGVSCYTPDLFSSGSFYCSGILKRVLSVRWSKFVTTNLVMHSRADIPTGILSFLNKLPCDLVHLHWLGANTISIEEIGNIDKPVVWTLHDMWAFCGAEHYSPDGPAARFRLGYHPDNRTEGEAGPDMNRSVWIRKKKTWLKPITLVCPSQWMADCASESLLCQDWPILRIPNPLNLDLWKPLPKNQARALLNLPQDKRIVLFGAIGGERDPRKGADLLREALRALKVFCKEDVHLVVFGQSEPETPVSFEYPVTYLGRFQDEISMVAIYNSADIMLVPSRQDNLPQTAVEAQACGVPVVAFDIGGLKDIVEHQRTGYLAKPFDTEDFAERINLLLEDWNQYAQMARAARQLAEEKFAAPVIAEAYSKLYQQVLSR
jgi:glycosyltransferase involved in cell wall biosynthesis